MLRNRYYKKINRMVMWHYSMWGQHLYKYVLLSMSNYDPLLWYCVFNFIVYVKTRYLFIDRLLRILQLSMINGLSESKPKRGLFNQNRKRSYKTMEYINYNTETRNHKRFSQRPQTMNPREPKSTSHLPLQTSTFAATIKIS